MGAPWSLLGCCVHHVCLQAPQLLLPCRHATGVSKHRPCSGCIRGMQAGDDGAGPWWGEMEKEREGREGGGEEGRTAMTPCFDFCQ